MFGFRTRHKLTLPRPEDAPLGRAQALSVPERHYVNGKPLDSPFPKAWSWRCSAWVVSGARNGCSGNCPAYIRPWSATPAATPKIPRMRKFAAG